MVDLPKLIEVPNAVHMARTRKNKALQGISNNLIPCRATSKSETAIAPEPVLSVGASGAIKLHPCLPANAGSLADVC